MKSTQICIKDFVMATLEEPRLSTVCVIHVVLRPIVLHLPQFIEGLERLVKGLWYEMDLDRRFATVE